MTLRFIRRKVAQPLFMIPMCALILYFTVDVKAHAANAASNYSGEELFKGIFFADGRVAAAIPELDGFNVRSFISDPAKLQSALERQNAICTAMSATGYFATLQEAVATHDQLRIQSTIQVGSELMKTKTAELGYGIPADVEKSILSSIKPADLSKASTEEIRAAVHSQAQSMLDTNSLAILCCIAIAIILIILLALLLVFAVETSDNSLYQERLVNSIAHL